MDSQQVAILREKGEIVEVGGYDCFSHSFEVEAKDDLSCEKCNLSFPAGTTLRTFFAFQEKKTITKWPCGCVSICNFAEVKE